MTLKEVIIPLSLLSLSLAREEVLEDFLSESEYSFWREFI